MAKEIHRMEKNYTINQIKKLPMSFSNNTTSFLFKVRGFDSGRK